jgi:EmrB/QacA subfamily drug resistance transporter
MAAAGIYQIDGPLARADADGGRRIRLLVEGDARGSDRRSRDLVTRPPSPRASLVVAILGSTMAFLDGTVVNVALPVMQRVLGATVAEMQWIVEAYALVLAALILVGGALGDRLGRKRVFLVGVVLFALASAACGAAESATALIVARALQGIGGALLVPGSLALITAAYPDEARGRAIGTWSAASAITGAVGPVLGGWVVTHASWRWLFLFNVPIAAVVVALAARGVDESRDDSVSGRVDVAGALLAIVGLGAIVVALLDAPTSGGLASPKTLALLGAGAVTLVAFVIVEARTKHPMMPLALFRSRTFAGTNLLTLALYASLGGGLFFLPFDLVQVEGYSPAEAGGALLPLIVLVSVMSPFAGAVVKRFGTRVPLVVGPLIAAGGFALLAVPTTGGVYWTTFFPGVSVLGVGLGITVAPLTTAVMGSVDARHAGVASGVNNAVSRAAGLLAVAALGVVLTSRFDGALEGGLDQIAAPSSVRAVMAVERAKLAGANLDAIEPSARAAVHAAVLSAYTSGFRAMMLVCAALAVAGALFSALFVEPRSPAKT